MRPSRLAVALCALALVLPGSALAQAPFAPLPSAPPAPPETVTVAPPRLGEDSDGLSGWQQALITAAGAALVIGIGVAIARDARRVAPTTAEEMAPKADRKSTVAPAQRKKTRAAGKRAKAARKQTKRRAKR